MNWTTRDQSPDNRPLNIPKPRQVRVRALAKTIMNADGTSRAAPSFCHAGEPVEPGTELVMDVADARQMAEIGRVELI